MLCLFIFNWLLGLFGETFVVIVVAYFILTMPNKYTDRTTTKLISILQCFASSNDQLEYSNVEDMAMKRLQRLNSTSIDQDRVLIILKSFYSSWSVFETEKLVELKGSESESGNEQLIDEVVIIYCFA